MNKRIVAPAGWSALVAFVLVGVALVLWPEEQNALPAGRDEPMSPEPSTPEAAPFPPPPAAAVEPPPAAREDDPVPAVEEDGPVLCDGCLNERAVLDVVETYLRHLDPVYLQGEIWAHPLADVAPDTPGPVDGLPPLPPGLPEAPEFNPMGMSIDTRRYPVETTWIVWLQTGWVPQRAIEQRIRTVEETTIGELRATVEELRAHLLPEHIPDLAALDDLDDDVRVESTSGDLPEVALSWRPIKKQAFVAVDGRTGELRPDGIFRLTSIGVQPEPPPHHGRALELARERAGHWLRKERQARSP